MKKIACYALSGIAALVLLIGIIHASIVVSNHHWNARVHITQIDRDGRRMVTSEVAADSAWRQVQVPLDRVDRVSEIQETSREIREMQRQLDNWNLFMPLSENPTDAQVNQNARQRAMHEAEIAIMRVELRAMRNAVNLAGLATFFTIYMSLFAVLSIAGAILIVKLNKDCKKGSADKAPESAE
ncbi:MAG: hypothetical protein FWC82_01990 [Firmicutes bacterium]|nr:hypothetical protein [Bacillota bacterium]